MIAVERVVGATPQQLANYATVLKEGVDLGDGLVWDSRYGFYLRMDGSHADGLDRVPFDGYRAILHEGERVQTATAARNSDVEMAQMRDTMHRLQASSEKTAELLDGLVTGRYVLQTEVSQ